MKFASSNWSRLSPTSRYHGSRSAPQAYRLVTEDANRLLRWLQSNGVPVDPGKTRALKFAVGAKVHDKALRLEGHNHPVPASTSVRYLGVWLDPRLTFKEHAKQVSHRGMALAAHLRRLNTVTRGIPPA